jgi:hypothetical protein
MSASAANMRAHYKEHGHHNSDKTKENNESLKQKAAKISDSLRRYYATHSGWSLGLTKDTSSIIESRSKKISASLKGRFFSDVTLEKMRKAKLLTHDEVQKRLKEKQLKLIDEYVDTVTKARIECTICSTIFERCVGAVFNNEAKCPTCFPPWSDKTSRWQQDVYAFIQTLAPDAVLSDRKTLGGMELDILIPSRMFAIECNGLYWHSEAANRFEHDHAEKKRLLSLKAGVSLFTLFEDEWRDKRPIIESMLRHRLGFSTKVDARKLKAERCEPEEVREFINQCHLDGHVRAQFAVRLVTSSGEIVGACSLRWARNGADRTTIEIARLCFKLGTHVRGGVSKLLSKAKAIARENNAARLMSYSDNRLGGNGYATSGMKFNGTTVARFWWTDFMHRYDRFKYRANKKQGLTEKQVAEAAGVYRIYGCSNSRYVLDVTA